MTKTRKTENIRKRIDKAGNVRWDSIVDLGRDGQGKRVRQWKSFDRYEDARAWRIATLDAHRRRDYQPPTTQTVAQYLDEWLATVSPSLKGGTASTYEKVCRLYLKPHIGAYRLSALDRQHVGAMYSALVDHGGRNGRPLGASSVDYVGVVLRAALADAVEHGRLARNPASAKAVKPPRVSRKEMECWTADELERFLLAAQGNDFYAAFRLAAFTGMRRGEIAALRWGDIDFATNRVYVQRSRAVFTEQGKQRLVDGTPKSDRPRVISIDAETADILSQHRLEQARRWYPNECTGPQHDVFLTWRGGKLNPQTLGYEFLKLIRELPGQPRISFHGLRHTHATLLLKQGVHPKVVQERLGHANISITMDTYSHVIEGMDAGAAESFAALFSRKVEAAL